MRIYIAGPMTGLPDNNYPAFDRMAHKLRALGYTVCNPAENAPPDDPTWGNWMRLAIGQLVTCDAVVLLCGWTDSKGASLEYLIARHLGIPTILEEEL